jgi:hypothetical protein
MPATAAIQVFTSVRTVGGLLPADMLRNIAEGKDVSASKPADYHVVGGGSVKDAAERHWDYLGCAGWARWDSVGPDGRDATGLAIGNWLLPLFEELGFGRLQASPGGITADDGTAVFSVTHLWRHLPIHLVGWDADLDRRPAAGDLPPQSLLQQCLNRTSAHLWGIVSNGRQLRILRDSSALAGAAYLEIDLEAMFDGELFEEFILLYRLLHASRWEVEDGAASSTCRMEKWRTEAIEAGTRALDLLRDGVEAALVALGTGFRRHPANTGFRDDLDPELVKRALLRLAYRLLFWFVAEERDALHAPVADEATADKKAAAEKARKRYEKYFSARRLRDASLRRPGTPHGDLWQAVRFVLDGLGREDGRPELGLSGLGGIYDQTGTDQLLRDLQLSNECLISAIRSLSRVRDKSTGRYRRVDYLNLGAEELGSIYESLLELVPKWGEDRQFVLNVAGGNERKKTGSYYTPTSLIDRLLDSSLDPVLDDATKRADVAATAAETDAAEAIASELLRVTVCDPACGSGHFLVAAARRIAKRLAAVREHNPEPSAEAIRHARRDVVAHCVYGVDLNPMAVELAKVSLWMEAQEPGKPLTFLDAHIKCGNALIGMTPKLINGGIPAGAFKPIEGDDPKFARSLERANSGDQSLTAGQRRIARFTVPSTLPGLEGDWDQEELFGDADIFSQSNTALAAELARIADLPDGDLRQVHAQAAAYRKWTKSADAQLKHLVADAWCAAFVWIKREDAPPAIVNRVFRRLKEEGRASLPPATATEIDRLRAEYSFFHWHLEFPDIFRVADNNLDADPDTGWSGGFSCVLANPPWDKVDFEDKKYFSVVEPEIALITGQDRRRRIEEWEEEHPGEAGRYRAARRKVKGTFGFASTSEAYPWCAKGLTAPGVNSLQVDQLFTERFAAITAPGGRVGCIIPTAIATGAGGQFLFGDFAQRSAVASLYDFENRRQLFPAVDSRQKFCLLSLTGKALPEPAARYAFFLLDPAELDDADRAFALSPEELKLINPNTRTLPIFRNRRDAALTAEIYRQIPALWDETKPDGNLWGITFKRLFDMTDDSDLFHTREELDSRGWRQRGNVFTRDGKRILPLYEAKMVDFFNHRAADVVKSETAVTRQNQPRYLTSTELRDPVRYATSLSWIAADGLIPTRRNGRDVDIPGVDLRLTEVEWDRGWLCGWCDVTSSTNERTAIPAFIPRTAAGHTFPLMLPRVSPALTAALIAAQSSLVFDFVSRQKIGGIHMNLFLWKQLPVPTPAMMEPYLTFIVPRTLELTYTAYDMTPLGRDLGDDGEPFVWNEKRRAELRAELDAFFFRMYQIDDRDDVDYILETFQTETGGIKHNEIAKHGRYLTKELVLAAYDRMATSDAAGVPYASPISPPPGDGPRHPAP